MPTSVQASHYSGKPLRHHLYLLPALAKHLPTDDRLRVADLGCGDGSLTVQYAKSSWDVVGVDASETGIRIARERYPQIRWLLGDLNTPLESEGPFDLIVSCEVIEHLYDPHLFIANCHSMLKQGGRVVLTTPYNGYLKNIAIAALGQVDKHHGPLTRGGHIKFWSRETLGALLVESGFTNLRFGGCGRVAYLWKSMVMSAQKP